MTEQKDLYIAYESWHIDGARELTKNGTIVVCLDFMVERGLKKQNIPAVSLRDFIESDIGEEEWWLLAQEVAREWYRLPAMKFFKYRGIRLGEVTEPIMMAEYLAELFYYVRIFIELKKKYPHALLRIPVRITDQPLMDERCLVPFERRFVSDAARMVGFESVVLAKPEPRQHTPRMAGKRLLVRLYNALMSFLPVPIGRRVKIYASEYWSHIAPILEQMDDVELVLMDTEELTHIPWKQLLTHRIRARHPNAEISGTDRNIAARLSKEFTEQWGTARPEVAEYLARTQGQLDWSPVLEACEYLVNYSVRVIPYIDSLRRIIQEEKPDIVLQLGSLSDRYHLFFVVARVAAELHVPSVELQHASPYIDPRIVYSRIENEYLATYGMGTNAWYERVGHASERLVPVGSPRFDQHVRARAEAPENGRQLLKKLGLDISRPVLFVAVPYSAAGLFYPDSYDLADFFQTIRTIQSNVPGLQILFKCRNYRYVSATKKYLEGLFSTDYAVAGNEDVFALLCASDGVVSGTSTLIYQAMLAQKPILLYPWKTFDTYHAQVYADAIPLVYTAPEVMEPATRMLTDVPYRDEFLTRQKRFLKDYLFDGKSVDRIAALLEKLSRKNDIITL